jgi:hypothetical protein
VKKLFVYRIESYVLFNIIRIFLYQLSGYKIFIWGDHNLPLKGLINIKFPPSRYSMKYLHDSKVLANIYFVNFYKISTFDNHGLDYIRKHIDIKGLDYYAFKKTIADLITDGDKVILIAPHLLKAIHGKVKANKNYWLLLVYPFYILRLTLLFSLRLYLSVIQINKFPVPEILYLRKKTSPDMGEFSLLASILNDENNIKFSGTYLIPGRLVKKFGVFFISSFEGISLNYIKSFVHTLVQSFKDLKFYLANGIDESIFRACLSDTFTAHTISNLSPSIICGQLLDKPFYILLSKYNNTNLLMVSLNESFFFPPAYSFDFNHLDQYYSMNKIDEQMINGFGGKIKTFKQVEFFRKGDITNNGISKDISEEIRLHPYSIVITTAQVFLETSGYLYWSYDELDALLQAILKVAKESQDILFIIKEKKGELKLMPPSFNNEVQKASNIIIVRSNKPKMLEFNKFEDLMDKVDLLISMCHTSTTVWQAISRNKPAIAINDIHPRTILSNYKGYECNLDELQETISYWKSLTTSEVYKSTETMKTIFNIGNSDGISQIATDLEHLSKKIADSKLK